MDKRKLENILDKLQITLSVNGYKYWIVAVEKYLENKNLTKKALYKEIANTFDTTASRVERSLRYACKGKKQNIQKYFNVNYSINNSTLLELLTREMEHKQ